MPLLTSSSSRKGFTLVELLIAIGVVAILSTVVIFAINPAQMLAQGRDSNRISDISSLSIALADYQSTVGGSMGASSTVYISIPDPLATSTAGDQCQGLGLPALPTGLTYQCAPSSTYRNTDGTGWVPVNIKTITPLPPIATLPADPVNSTSTNLYYTYETDGVGGYKVTAFFESQKDAPLMASDGGNDPTLYEKGSNLALASGRGLIAYWPLDEGSGTTAADASGNQNNGTWSGSSAYAPGKVGPFSAQFNGGTIRIQSLTYPRITNDFTIALWFFNTSSTWSSAYSLPLLEDENYTKTGYRFGFNVSHYLSLHSTESGGTVNIYYPKVLSTSTWYYTVFTYSGTQAKLYLNGALVATGAGTIIPTTSTAYLGFISGYPVWTGYLDDIRIYNRALSATEISTLYNSEE